MLHGASGVLLVDLSPRSDLLSLNNVPVWPIRAESDRSAVMKFCDLVGAPIKQVTAHKAHALSRGGLVVGIGQSADRPGRLFAHLTRRRFKLISASDELDRETANAQVFVGLHHAVSVDVLHDLYWRPRGRSAPGIITADSPAELTQQVLVRAACSHLAYAKGSMASLLLPTLQLENDALNLPVSVHDKLTSHEEIRSVCSKGAELLAILTHSDGIDAKLSRNLSLCAIHKMKDHVLPKPYCAETGQCFRHGKPLVEVSKGGQIVEPEFLRARILLFASCNTIVDYRSNVSPHYGFMSSVMSTGHVGLGLASWSLVTPNIATLLPLIKRLLSGATVGQAVSEFNKTRASNEAALKFCILGDPRVRMATRLSRSQTSSCRTTFSADERLNRKALKSAGGGVAFLRAYLMNIFMDCGEDDLAKTVSNALVDLRTYEHLLWNGQLSEDDTHLAGKSLRRSILAVIAKRGAAVIAHDWIRLVLGRRQLPVKQCPHCNGRLIVTSHDFRNSEISPRVVASCGTCHLVRDAPKLFDIFLTADRNGSFKLQGSLPKNHWMGLLRLSCSDDKKSIVVPWPAANSGNPVRSFIPNLDRWPDGPLKASFVLVHGTDLIVTNAPVRAPATRIGSSWKSQKSRS